MVQLPVIDNFITSNDSWIISILGLHRVFGIQLYYQIFRLAKYQNIQLLRNLLKIFFKTVWDFNFELLFNKDIPNN